MKILLVTNYQPPRVNSGGIEYAAEELRKCWIEKGHEVTWLSSDIPAGNTNAPARSVRIPASNVLQERFALDIPMFSPAHIPAILAAIRANDVVIAHSLAPGIALLAAVLALREGKRTIVTQHVPVIERGNVLLDYLQRQWLIYAARYVVRKGAELTFVSERVREWFLAYARIARSTTRITPVGINQDDFYLVPDSWRPELKQKWGLPEDRTSVLFVGRFEEKKGLAELREIAQALPDVRFSLRGAGTIDPKSWGLSNVVVLPYATTSELRELYTAHDLLILPSFGEGFPVVIPQAMACGTPCLISDEAFVGHNKDWQMFLVRPRTVSGFVYAIRAFIKEQILVPSREALSAYATSVWDWKYTADLYLRKQGEA